MGRALSLARREMATGKWFDPAAEADPFAQWSLPVLYERTTDGPLVAPQRQSMTQQRARAGSVMIGGDRTLQLPGRASFVGRRAEIRRHLRQWMQGEAPRLLFTGPGRSLQDIATLKLDPEAEPSL